MAKAHERVLELVFAADDSAETVVVSAVNYYRDASTQPSAGFPLTFTQTSPNTTGTRIVFGELVPPPTDILLTFTVVA